MVPNVTIAEAVIASCLDLRPPNGRVVIADLDFPTVGYVWHSVPGAEVRTVRSWDGITLPTETVLQAIDSRVAVVLLSHALFRSGVLLDVETITRAAHEAGAMVVLDCYQSAGTIPFSLTELGVDAAVGGSVKWLCGGPGAAWLYVRPDLQDSLVPRFAGWQADREPFSFRPGPLEPAAGMWRFLSGTPNVPGWRRPRRRTGSSRRWASNRSGATRCGPPSGSSTSPTSWRYRCARNAVPSGGEARWSSASRTRRRWRNGSSSGGSSSTAAPAQGSGWGRTSTPPGTTWSSSAPR